MRRRADTPPTVMLETLATLAFGAAMTAFAIFAVLLNEGERAARPRKVRGRRKAFTNSNGQERHGSTPTFSAPGLLPGEEPAAAGAPTGRANKRRLAVGEFLFGALFLSGTAPIAFAELARTAGDSGLDISQVLSWLARAEEGGLIERVTDLPGEGESPGHPAVRLTQAGMDVARNNRRGADRATSVESDHVIFGADSSGG